MSGDKIDLRAREKLLQQENEQLRAQLAESEQALNAIRNGEVDALIVNGIDGEQVYSLAGSDHIYRVIVETMNEAALTITPDGAITFANQRFSDLLKLTSNEILGRKLIDFLDDSHQPTLTDFTSHTNGSPSRQRLLMRAPNGSQVPVQVSASTLNIGYDTSTCLIVSDLTELEASRRSIRSLSDHTQKLEASQEALERAVHERTLALVEANRTLEALAGQLRKLALELTMAEQHERNQLSKILHDGLQQYLVAAKLLIGGLVEQSTDATLKQTAIDAEHLLEESIQVSRSLAAELSPPILHDGGLWPALGWLSRWMSEKHKLRVEMSLRMAVAPALTQNVKVLLFEAVRELLLNVVKHSGTLAAVVELAQAPNGRLRIAISDYGKGFDAAGSFTGEDRNGFGLFSIQERIGLIGGSFRIDSSPGNGARFTLEAPLGTPEKPMSDFTGERPPEPGPGSSGRLPGNTRILLVDDHPVMREGLARLLAQEPDFEVIGQSNDGRQAVEQAETLRPDVILMDISMPAMNGIDAARIIHQRQPAIRIIGLSLYSEEERAREMMDAGAVFYLTKSGPPADLKLAIRSCMDEKRPINLKSAASHQA